MKTGIKIIANALGASLMLLSPLSAKGKSFVRQLQLKAELERKVMPANSRQQALIKITIQAPESNETSKRSARVNLAIVLDKSGSMGTQNKMEKAKEAAITALKMLGPDDVFSLIVYDNDVRTLIPATPVKDKAEIEAAIRRITPGGSTALFAGVSVGANEVRKNSMEKFVNRIVLLSDGLANVGPSAPGDLGRLGASLIKEGISVSTVGVGNDYNEDLMTALSQNSDGNFYFVENSNDLPMIFSKELGSALQVAAKSLNLRIKCPAGIKPQGILGHECKINGNSIDLYFNQVYGGHGKSLILQVEVPPEKAQQTLEIANVELAYKDATNGFSRSANKKVEASFSASNEAVTKSINKAVMDEVAIQQSAVIKEKAIKEADKGDFKKAQQLLDESKKILKKTAEITGNVRLEKKMEQVEEEKSDLKKSQTNMDYYSNTRKKIKGRSYQDRNSQMYKQ
jgi:Ca-activated chloride channel family protein